MKLIALSLVLGMLAVAASPTPANSSSSHDADAYFAAGDFPRALAAARAAIALDSADAKAHLIAGTVEVYANALDAARADLSAVPARTEDGARAKRLLEEAGRRERLARGSDTNVPVAAEIVPFERTDPLPAVAVLVNGTRGIFQIDTGAPGLSLDSAFARRLKLSEAAGSRVAHFAGGPPRRIPQAPVASFSLGRATIRNLTVDVLPIRMMSKPSDPVIDGVIGTGIFERFAAFTLDYARGRLVLYAPGTPVEGPVETRVPLWLVGDHFLFTRGAIAGIEGLVLLDTGLIGGGVAPSAAVVRRAHLSERDAGLGMVPGGARIALRRVVAPTVRIGASVERNVAGFYSPGPSPLAIFPFTVIGAVSHDFFRKRALTIDFATMQVLISPALSPRFTME